MANSCILKKRCAAFTLVELVITMALFLLVAALVIAYIVFMHDYTERNENNSDRAEQLAFVRREIDRWFSWFDAAGYTFIIPTEDDTFAAKFASNGEEYTLSLRLMPTEIGGETLEFELTPVFCAEYPVTAPYGDIAEEGVRRVSQQCPMLVSLSVTPLSLEWEYSPEESDALTLRFLVTMHVTEGFYACEIVYR